MLGHRRRGVSPSCHGQALGIQRRISGIQGWRGRLCFNLAFRRSGQFPILEGGHYTITDITRVGNTAFGGLCRRRVQLHRLPSSGLLTGFHHDGFCIRVHHSLYRMNLVRHSGQAGQLQHKGFIIDRFHDQVILGAAGASRVPPSGFARRID